MNHRILALAVLLSLAPLAGAQQGPAPKPVTAAERQAVVARLAEQLQAKYVFPDAAKTLATALRAREAAGAYAAATDVGALSNALAKDLRTLGKDGHFNVVYAPGFEPQPAGQIPTAEQVEDMRAEIASHGYGIDSIARLPGNVGYMELRGFGPAELVGDAFSAAITLLSGTDALILDLRRNGGGQPNSVAYLMSHFFAKGDERHLNDLYSRASNSTRQYWTNPAVGPRYTKPVYVLTSARTFSGGEECAYDFQTQKRGVIVGESTGGGSNPGDMYALGSDFAAFIPDGRAINPVTKTNWEHVGVKPDIAVPAADARRTAHLAILRDLIKASSSDEAKAELQQVLAKVEAGKEDAPVYSGRQ
ncbi:S41 family peptidase [Cognatilysobacter bugurensis]|uniref:Interphotoreceptor retinoid-binding protein n=1 Tax=Cognatilysobacter bugurensis TaxID=543356 RepID=A0A918W7T5_9GAMM|nr:S41 family peptidase [Lysobacter bugurensis]GHA78711.1 interphotoreceptor retinoid-binding protein [Lysobacter bugurensis]